MFLFHFLKLNTHLESLITYSLSLMSVTFIHIKQLSTYLTYYTETYHPPACKILLKIHLLYITTFLNRGRAKCDGCSSTSNLPPLRHLLIILRNHCSQIRVSISDLSAKSGKTTVKPFSL